MDPASDDCVELDLDGGAAARPSADLDLGDETGRVLLYQALQRGLLGAMAFVVVRGAIRRPAGAALRLARWAIAGLNPKVKPCSAHPSP